MNINKRIERLLEVHKQAKQDGASQGALTAIEEVIEELETKAGCPCHKSNALRTSEIREKFSNLEAEAILTNADVMRCPLHGPVIAQHEREEQIP